MLNNFRNLFYSYSLSLIKIVDLDNKLLIKQWINYLKFLNFLFNKFYIRKYFFLDKMLFYKEILYILKKNILFLNKDMENFFYIIIKDNLIYDINLIYKNFIIIYEFKKNIKNIFIYYKHIFNNKNLFLIRQIIKNKVNGKLNFFLIKDKFLIAGFKIKVNNFVIDCSILNILNKIKLLNYKEYKNVF